MAGNLCYGPIIEKAELHPIETKTNTTTFAFVEGSTGYDLMSMALLRIELSLKN